MESDEELMTAVARGEERALATLVERHAARLHAFLVRIAGSRDDADDLLQDTWVRVARVAPKDANVAGSIATTIVTSQTSTRSSKAVEEELIRS